MNPNASFALLLCALIMAALYISVRQLMSTSLTNAMLRYFKTVGLNTLEGEYYLRKLYHCIESENAVTDATIAKCVSAVEKKDG